MILIVGGAFQGKTEYAEKNFGDSYVIENHYHIKVREQLKKGLNPLEEAKKLTDNNIVIVSDEIGYGLVPVDAFEREYREINGRVNCFFAEKAEQVIRVVCGIGTRIK